MDQINLSLKYNLNNKKQIDIVQLKEKIKQNIFFEFKLNYLSNINEIFEQNKKDAKALEQEEKNVIDRIIDVIKGNKKLEYFEDELCYYYKQENILLLLRLGEKNNINEYINKTEIDEVLYGLDYSLFILNFKLNKLEHLKNDLT